MGREKKIEEQDEKNEIKYNEIDGKEDQNNI